MELIILFVVLIFIIAFIIKSATGFGENLIIVPFLLLFYDMKYILPLSLSVIIIADVYYFFRFYKDIDFNIIKKIIPFAVLGVILGSLIIPYVNNLLMKKYMGFLVILFSIEAYVKSHNEKNEIKKKIKRKKNISEIWKYLAGFFSGICRGMIGIGGPPLVMYFTMVDIAKKSFRATAIMIFFIFDIVRVGTYAFSGLFTSQILYQSIFLIPAFAVGSFIGIKINEKINEHFFKQFISVMLFCVGVYLLF